MRRHNQEKKKMNTLHITSATSTQRSAPAPPPALFRLFDTLLATYVITAFCNHFPRGMENTSTHRLRSPDPHALACSTRTNRAKGEQSEAGS